MLRLIFVAIIILTGGFYALQSAFFGLLFYLWNAYFRPEFWVWNPEFVAPLHLSMVIGIYISMRTALSFPNLRFNARTLLLILFILQAIVGCITSERPDISWAFMSDFWKVLLISFLIVLLVDDRKKVRMTFMVIALSLGFEAAKQGWVSMIRAPGAQNNNPIDFLGDNNGVAVGCMMLAPIFGALAQTATKKWERHMHRFLGLGVFIRGVTTYSRGGFLAAGVVGIFAFLNSEKKLRAAVGIVIVALLLGAAMPQAFWDRMGTITASDDARDESAQMRLIFWRVAVTMAVNRPLTGVGLDGYEASFSNYIGDANFGGIDRATHSTWFGILADLGFPGLILFVSIWLMSIVSCWSVIRAGRGDPDQRQLVVLAKALMAGLLAYGVGATFLSVQYGEMAWHFFGLSTALYLVSVDERAAVKIAAARVRPQRAMEAAPAEAW